MRLPGRPAGIIILIALILPISACAQPPENCPPPTPVDISDIEQVAFEQDSPFRFPLDDYRNRFITDAANFVTYGSTSRGPEYHAAEDIHKPAGTPVYAIADGEISFSGPMGGYGWLIIIDHPQANLYSLYGHLSPSSWYLDSGQVRKGDMIAYLGDSDENGGSKENPLRTHLHFGLRAGQKSDYPARGQWRWMAGWIKPCPQDLGWLQPSVIITGQTIPQGGFLLPNSSFVEKWTVDLVLGGVYLIGALSMLVFGIKKEKPYLLLLSSGVMLATGFYFYQAGWRMGLGLFGLALLLAGSGVYLLVRRFTNLGSSKA